MAAITMVELEADLVAIPPELRDEYIRVGRQFGSDATLGQADRTLNACAAYGSQVAAEGFGGAQVTQLTRWRDGLVLAMGGRLAGQADRKTTNKDLLAAKKKGKSKRFGLRSALKGAPSRLRRLGTEEGQAAATRVDGALAQTESAGENPKRLIVQLDLLAGALEDAAVQAVVGVELAAAKAAEGRAAAESVRAAEAKRSHPAGTPQETQRMDLLDGLIVELVREARAAARAAARETGDPAIETAFALEVLYA